MYYGRKRDPKIRREERYCSKHGVTTFAQYTSGMGHSKAGAAILWRCMECMCEKDRAYRARVAEGTHVPVSRNLVIETRRSLCTECFIELAAQEPGPKCRECVE